MSIYKGTTLLAGLPDVSNKANVDMDNLSSAGESYLAEIGMPSDTYEDFTLPTSGTSKTAPANGYYIFRKTANAAGQYIGLANRGQNGTDTIADYTLQAYGVYMQLAVTCPAKKGDKVEFGYNTGGVSNLLRFVYAKGEV